MIDVLHQEAKTGFRRLAGTRLTGTIPLDQTVLNEALARHPQAPSGLTIEVLSSNHLVVRYGLVQAAAVVDEVIRTAGEPPQVTIELASRVVAWALKRMIDMPAIRIDGRRVTLDIGALAGADEYRSYWPLLDRAGLRTSPGQVHVDFEIAVK